MPPPPPSKSYLLVINDSDLDDSDDSSSGEDEELQRLSNNRTSSFFTDQQQRERSRSSSTSTVSSTDSTSKQKISSSYETSSPDSVRLLKQLFGILPEENDGVHDDIDDEDEDDIDGEQDDDADAAAGSKKKKKKKNKKKKKKKKKSENTATITTALEDGPDVACDNAAVHSNENKPFRRSVSFGSVHVREYGRCLGDTVVPSDGGWPLGLSWEVHSCTLTSSSPFLSSSSSSFADDDSNSGGSGSSRATAVTGVSGMDSTKNSNSSSTQNKKKKKKKEQANDCSADNNSSHSEVVSTSASMDGGVVGVVFGPQTVEEFERAKKERLRARWVEVHSSSSLEGAGEQIPSTPPPEDDALETRMWDHKSKKNPLFGPVFEQQRMEILLSSSIPDGGGESNDGGGSAPSASATTKQPSSPSTSSKDRRKRSNSFSTGKQSSSSSSSNRKRSNSFSTKADSKSNNSSSGGSGTSKSSNPNTFTEVFNDMYPQTDVHHVRNELEQIRVSRSEKGCSCRKLQVYLPPTDGTECGKKAQKRRMALLKVKEELRKRKALPSNEKSMSREALEQLLHDIVEKEPCCQFDCSCVTAGISCQENACSCWVPSHQTTSLKQSLTSDTTTREELYNPENIKTRCGNAYGMYTVDIASIDAYRSKYLGGSYFCQEIKS